MKDATATGKSIMTTGSIAISVLSGGGEKKEGEGDEKPEKVPCIEKGPVSTFFAVAVLVNAGVIGVDTHFRAIESNAFEDIGLVIDMVFFVIFFVELILRIWADRCPKFWCEVWNLLDLFLVLSSIVDLVFTFTQVGGDSDLGKLRAIRLLKVTRIVRLVRIVRVLRFRAILRAIRGLILIVKAIVGALKSLGWVVLMFAVASYLSAIVTTEFLGIANIDEETFVIRNPQIDAWFGDMIKSMFTLVQLITLNGWANIARECGHQFGSHWKWIFLIYVISMNSILMNVVLATLIEKIILINQDIQAAKDGEVEDAESWMKTPSSLESDSEEEEEEETEEEE